MIDFHNYIIKKKSKRKYLILAEDGLLYEFRFRMGYNKGKLVFSATNEEVLRIKRKASLFNYKVVVLDQNIPLLTLKSKKNRKLFDLLGEAHQDTFYLLSDSIRECTIVSKEEEIGKVFIKGSKKKREYNVAIETSADQAMLLCMIMSYEMIRIKNKS